jgi:hypothetical protein
MSRIYNRSSESVFVHATWVGDKGTIDTWSMGPQTDKVFRPGWPNKPVINDTPYAITFWESQEKYRDNFLIGLGLAGFGGLLAGLAGGGSTSVAICAEIYKVVGFDVMREVFAGKGVVGIASNVFYDGGWTVYHGRGLPCDVGCVETTMEHPRERNPKYAWSVDGNRNQTKVYYPPEVQHSIDESLSYLSFLLLS